MREVALKEVKNGEVVNFEGDVVRVQHVENTSKVIIIQVDNEDEMEQVSNELVATLIDKPEVKVETELITSKEVFLKTLSKIGMSDDMAKRMADDVDKAIREVKTSMGDTTDGAKINSMDENRKFYILKEVEIKPENITSGDIFRASDSDNYQIAEGNELGNLLGERVTISRKLGWKNTNVRVTK